VRRAALLVVLLAAAAGCRSVPTELALAADDPRPAALLRAWEQQAASRRALRGRAHLAVDGDALQVRAKQILVLERPSRLRVEVQGLLSQTLAVLVTDGPRYELFRAETASFESGDVHPGLLWQVAHLALTPEEAIDLVLGAPRVDASLAPLRAFASGAGEVTVELGDAAGRGLERRAFDGAGQLRRLDRLAGDGSVAWSARFDRYQPVAGVPFAHQIQLDVAQPPTRAELELSSVELNPVLPADIFRLRPGGPPAGEGG
jgi:hypothetical protein